MALTILAANNATSVLASAISATATTLTIANGTGARYPTPVANTSYFKLTLIDAATESINEIVHVMAVTGDTFTIVRGQEGTTARSWSVSDIAANMITAGTLSAMAQYDTPEFITATGGRLLNVQRFLTAGTFTYNKTPGTRFVIVEVQGGGGGGGGTFDALANQRSVAGGGGAGAYARSLISSAFDGVTLIIGAGGVSGPANSNTSGGVGGTTRFGDLIVCPGGNGGTFSSNWAMPIHTSGAPSGIATTPGNLYNYSAPHGTPGYYANNGWLSGAGASSLMGVGGFQVGQTTPGADAGGNGSGGGGASTGATSAGQIGGKGSPGAIIVWEFA